MKVWMVEDVNFLVSKFRVFVIMDNFLGFIKV